MNKNYLLATLTLPDLDSDTLSLTAIEVRQNADSDRITNVDSDINARIDSESSRLTSLDSDINARIDSESSRLTAIDSDINTRLNNDSDRLENLDSDVASVSSTVAALNVASPIAWARFDFDSDGGGNIPKAATRLAGYNIVLDSDTGPDTGVYLFTIDSDAVGGLQTYDINSMSVNATICNADEPPMFLCANVMSDYRVRVRVYTGLDHGAISLGDPINAPRVQFSVWGLKV